MKFNEIKQNLQKLRSQKTQKIYIPSVKKDLIFKSLNMSDLKALSRLSVYSDFDIDNEILKLETFDKLLAQGQESIEIDAKHLLLIDYLAYTSGIRKLLNNTLGFTFTCQECQTEIKTTLDVEKIFYNQIFSFKPQTFTFEKLDSSDNIWKFELCNFTMQNYLYYRFYIEKLVEMDETNPDLINEGKFIRPILYIKKIWKNDEEIEDWDEQLFSNKIKLFNSLPVEIIVNTTNLDDQKNKNTLSDFIQKSFTEEKIFQKIADLKVKCTNQECGKQYQDIYSFDDFFIF